MKFKIGDKILHKPSGCVGEYAGEYPMNINIKIPQYWREADCEPYRDPAPVVEAAKRALAAFAWLERHDGFDHHSKAVTDLRDALTEYDNE